MKTHIHGGDFRAKLIPGVLWWGVLRQGINTAVTLAFVTLVLLLLVQLGSSVTVLFDATLLSLVLGFSLGVIRYGFSIRTTLRGLRMLSEIGLLTEMEKEKASILWPLRIFPLRKQTAK